MGEVSRGPLDIKPAGNPYDYSSGNYNVIQGRYGHAAVNIATIDTHEATRFSVERTYNGHMLDASEGVVTDSDGHVLEGSLPDRELYFEVKPPLDSRSSLRMDLVRELAQRAFGGE
jgi:hypothetical protein